MRTEIVKDETYYLELYLIDENGDGKAGETINYSIYKSSTGSLSINGTLNDEGGGIYRKNIILSDLGQHLIKYITPDGYENIIEHITVVESTDQSLMVEVRDLVKRILGLVHENFRLFDHEYDNSGNLIEATIRTYPSALDCENDTNPIAEYKITSTYDVKGLPSLYKMVKL